jgi:hypothetical protein
MNINISTENIDLLNAVLQAVEQANRDHRDVEPSYTVVRHGEAQEAKNPTVDDKGALWASIAMFGKHWHPSRWDDSATSPDTTVVVTA